VEDTSKLRSAEDRSGSSEELSGEQSGLAEGTFVELEALHALTEFVSINDGVSVEVAHVEGS
jgi:hypothetical protein